VNGSAAKRSASQPPRISQRRRSTNASSRSIALCISA
jgi:hypothetical protein